MSTLGVCTQEGRCPLRPEEGTGCSQDGVSGCKMDALCGCWEPDSGFLWESQRGYHLPTLYRSEPLIISHSMWFPPCKKSCQSNPRTTGGFWVFHLKCQCWRRTLCPLPHVAKGLQKTRWTQHTIHTSYVTQTSFRTLLVDSASPAGHRRADCMDVYEAKLLPSRSLHTVQIVHTQPPVTSGKWWTL